MRSQTYLNISSVSIAKPVILATLLAFSCVACHKSSDSIKIKGSDSVLPIAQKEAEVFMEQDIQASVTVTGGGSGVGIAALISGTTDIAMASREMKVAEKLKLTDANQKLIEAIIAYDALAVVIHPSNPIKELTRNQIELIYTGKVNNWKEVGGEDKAVVPYARETSSGTYEYFKEAVLLKKEYHNSILSLNSNGAILQSVSQTPGAIGYVGLAYVNDNIKPVSVSFDEGKTFVMPSFDNAMEKKYPISRPLYFYFTQEVSNRVKPFLDFTFSEQGQNIIKEIGYVPVK